ncbi:MAG: surface carbohydrate biosynthesis protein, partial [Myxococcota bacterium]|nr:surface carbohydrate biosynthesis protein [Myxococcota bacterium]
AKLLFSLAAAERGYPVVLGARTTLHLDAATLPRGVYVAKSVRKLSTRMFGIYRNLGSEIVSWDEESLVRHPNPAFWRRQRLSKDALDLVRVFFAWGEADAEAFRSFPEGCSPTVHATGNPRLDLMRPELRGYFDRDVARWRERCGEFLLLNTNFGIVNHYIDAKSGVVPLPPGDQTDEDLKIGEGFIAYRRKTFEAFKTMLPEIAEAFPDMRIVVRPHPVEKHAAWEEIAARHDNVELVQEGNVLPWLLAARALIHNGCTTGVEAYGLGVASIAYEPVPNKNFDSELPNALSRRARSLDELIAELRTALDEGVSNREASQIDLAHRHMASLEGPLACERILDILDDLYTGPRASLPEQPGAVQHALAKAHASGRATWKRLRAAMPGNANSADYQKHRFPGVNVASLRASTDRFAKLLGRFDDIEISARSEDVFDIVSRHTSKIS